METDITGGFYMGSKTILVLSGIADEEELIKYGYRPNLVVGPVDKIEFPLIWWGQRPNLSEKSLVFRIVRFPVSAFGLP